MKIDKAKFELELARQCKGVRDLASQGFSTATILGARQGREMRIKTIGRLAKALGVPVEELIAKEG